MLSDAAVLVIGASSGMGKATAALLASQQARVMAVARRIDRLQQLQLELAQHRCRLSISRCDATRRAEVDRAVAETVGEFGRIDVLVYAAGTNITRRSLDVLSEDDWHALLEANLTGAFHCTQAVLPTMRRQQSGLIIYVSTGAVQSPDVSGVAYQASKHGLTGLARGTRVEEKKHGIRTTLIFPGLCDTEILQRRLVPPPPETLACALQPSDVAEAVAFVCRLDPRCHVPELQIFPARL
jgi:NADP-dependent 3-hydroxy acid dehydrogenase YdfG